MADSRKQGGRGRRVIGAAARAGGIVVATGLIAGGVHAKDADAKKAAKAKETPESTMAVKQAPNSAGSTLAVKTTPNPGSTMAVKTTPSADSTLAVKQAPNSTAAKKVKKGDPK